jgi:superfamily II DNA or RNA helicase
MAKRIKNKLGLTDLLSRLSYTDACKLLGPESKRLLSSLGEFEIDISRNVRITSSSLTVSFRPISPAVVTISHSRQNKKSLAFQCTQCNSVCEHIGAVFSLVLEEKLALGLADVPAPFEPTVELTDDELIARELEARKTRADEEKMTVRSIEPTRPWTDYQVSSKQSGRSYRVALRGMSRGQSYCNCPDYRKNTLGICKHIYKVHNRVKKKFTSSQLARRPMLKEVIVYLQYEEDITLRLQAPTKLEKKHLKYLETFIDRPIRSVTKLIKAIGELQAKGVLVTVYPDAEEYIQTRCVSDRIRRKTATLSKAGAKHPLRKELLSVELLPYQWQGILFAVGAGRAILADDMGLGKTIQGVGTAELLVKLADINRVLVVCPASLKAQWRSEIDRFSGRDSQIILGPAKDRQQAYDNDAFFTICNYEQVLRDVLCIERVHWDLIILDEGHRIKNWEAKTSRVIKSLRSEFALVLTGTPLENRLDELYSVAEFIDERQLGPGFRFYHRHRVTDDKGKLLGYRNLVELREKLKPILLRRTRDEVLDELPPRTTDIVRITPTQQQQDMHSAHMITVSSIVNKPYLTEMDLLRLQKALLMCRMTADSTLLVDKEQPGFSSKLEVLSDLITDLGQQPERKTVLFSEWTTMLGLIEQILNQNNIGYVRLDGQVPQAKRAALVAKFREDNNCQFFITTNAGSTGLNLQFANTVINVDLPWTPALLEQRIGRVHRMGQEKPVHVYILVTEGTLEEKLLGTLAAKHELSLAALDASCTIDEVNLVSGIDGLKQKLEVLLGAKPDAPVDVVQTQQTEKALEQRRERVAEAGGEMLSAALSFIGELLPASEPTPQSLELTENIRASLSECVEKADDGSINITLKLQDSSALDNLAAVVARLTAGR